MAKTPRDEERPRGWGPGSGRGGYHYDREERLSRPGAPRPRPAGRGFLRGGNRGLLILLLNIGLVCGLFLLLRQLLPGSTYEVRIEGLSLLLQASRQGEAVVASLTATRTGLGSPPGERISVRFRLEGGDELPVDGEVPAAWGRRTVLKAVLVPAEGSPGGLEVRAEVRLGEQVLLLRRRLPEDAGPPAAGKRGG